MQTEKNIFTTGKKRDTKLYKVVEEDTRVLDQQTLLFYHVNTSFMCPLFYSILALQTTLSFVVILVV